MISVIMTAFNSEKYVYETISSVLNQSYQDFEFIIVDDGSTDKTVEIIESFKDSRIQLYKLTYNQGVSAAILAGLQYASRPYIAKVDADDLYDTTRFEKQLSFLEHNPSIDLVDCRISYFSSDNDVTPRFELLKYQVEEESNSIIETYDLEQKNYWFPCITHSTMMYRKSILEKITYNPKFKIVEDYDFIYRLNKNGIKMWKIPEVLGHIRVYNSSLSVNKRESIINNIFEIKKNEITAATTSGRSVYIWGTGELGTTIFNLLVQNQMSENVKGFIDSNANKQGQQLFNLTVYDVLNIPSNSYIIIAASTGKFLISKKLDELGYKHLTDYLVIW